MVEKIDEMVGVECGVCHNEAFQLVEREVTIRVKCCPRCVAKVDFEQEDNTIKEANKAMGKKERLYFLKDKSFEWADNLHGKQVIVFWDANKHLIFSSTQSLHSVKGIAYRTTNECGGWGNVKVVIDPAEHCRIDEVTDYRWEGWGRDQKKVSYSRPRMDKQKYGLYLNLNGDGGYYTRVSWGCRKSLVVNNGQVGS